MTTEVFLGLDGEMTGSRSPEEYQLIQIGAYSSPKRHLSPHLSKFVSDIGYDTWNETPEAMEVNHFTADRIRRAPRPETVDAQFVEWLASEGIGPKKAKAVAIGWNVGSFDMPFVRRYLPESAKRFSYRSLDLNSVCFTIAEAEGYSWTSIKSAAKKYAEKVLGGSGSANWHDAGYDAQASYLAWEYLASLIAVREVHGHL